ncbi:MAG: ornithine carbamoyltransferase, partial [Verrucomicrobiota bacterium]
PSPDPARDLGRLNPGADTRPFPQPDVEVIPRCSGIPTVTALPDAEHPCQILTDIFTFEEERGQSIEGKVVTFVGDGACNVPASWVWAAARLGFELRIAAPKAYQPETDLIRRAGGSIHCTEDLAAAADGADLLYTDVWVSMGKEAEGAQRLKDLAGYQINEALVRRARPGALVMHCLPAYRGKEITEETLEAHAETIFREAENRLHTQKAIVDWMVG